MVTWPGGLSVRPADVAVLLPLGGEGQLEAVHGCVPGVLSRTGSAREPVARRSISKAAAEAGFEAPHYRIDGPHRLVSTSGVRAWEMDCRHAQADRRHLPERPVRAVGQARSRGDARGAESGQMRSVGPGFVPAVPQLRDPVLGPGLVPDLPLLADVVSTRTSSRARCTSRSRAPRGSASPRNWPRCRSRSTDCRTPTPSRPRRRWSSRAWSRSSCCATKKC